MGLAGAAGWWFAWGERMHLRLNEQELATLVEMVSLAAWVGSWNRRPTALPSLPGKGK